MAKKKMLKRHKEDDLREEDRQVQKQLGRIRKQEIAEEKG